jgi:hypothetical protein
MTIKSRDEYERELRINGRFCHNMGWVGNTLTCALNNLPCQSHDGRNCRLEKEVNENEDEALL